MIKEFHFFFACTATLQKNTYAHENTYILKTNSFEGIWVESYVEHNNLIFEK